LSAFAPQQKCANRVVESAVLSGFRLQDFAGARCFSAVNSLVIKRALLLGLGFLGFCFSLSAEQTNRKEPSKAETSPPRQLRPSALDTPARLTLSRPEFFNQMYGPVLTDGIMMLTLSVGQRLPASSELGSMGMAPLDYFEDELPSAAEEKQANAAPVDGKDLPSQVVNSLLNPIYYSGEIGVFYGRSSGKFDREIIQTYFLGTVGNDKFQITVGGAYGESNVDVPQFRSGSSKH
jgi:hypothetical protein